MSDPLRKQIDEPEAVQIDQECPAEQIDEPDPDKQIDRPDPTPSASATPEQEIPPNYRNRSTQTHKKRGTRSVRTQTVVAGTPTSSPTKRLLECPTFTEAQAVGEVTAVVTDIDNAQPLGELNEPKDATETCITTEIDFDVGSMTSSVSEESALSDSHIQIDVLSSSESDESSEEDFDFDKRTVLVEGKPPQEQIKFIIFEEANSEHYFEWTTGPCVSKMAAFHLFAGFCNSCNRNGIIESSSSISSVKDSKPEATRAVQHLKVLHYSRSVQRLECGTISEIARGQRGANCNCVRYACGQSWT